MTALPRVVVVGGGVAGLECLLALHGLAGRRLGLTLVAPDPHFVELAESVSVPTGRPMPRHRIDVLAAHAAADVVAERMLRVRHGERLIDLVSGAELAYDILVLAIGAQPVPAFAHAQTYDPRRPHAVAELMRDMEHGRVRRVGVVAAPGRHWTLPAYELALLLAEHGDAAVITLAVPEHQPLTVFGPRVAAATSELLDASGVTLWTSAFAEPGPGEPLRLAAHPGQRSVMVDRVIALPRLEAPVVPGLNDERPGFLAVDGFGRVRGHGDIYAIGDLTDHPIKQGGLAAQQADVAAASIAAGFGIVARPAPFRPVLRGRLRGAHGDLWLRNDPGREPLGEVSAEPLWWPPGKLAAPYLAPLLDGGPAPVDRPGAAEPLRPEALRGPAPAR